MRELIEKAADLSLAVYADFTKYGELFDTFAHDPPTGTDIAAATVGTGYLFVVVRGTEPTKLRDLHTDLKAWPVDGYHRGFLASASACEEFLRDETPAGQVPTVWTGHSLGGAVASILAELYGRPDDPVITFGAPKYAVRFRKSPENPNRIRFAHRMDPVPWVPALLYKHTAPAVKVGRYGLLSWVKAHSMVGYRANLSAI